MLYINFLKKYYSKNDFYLHRLNGPAHITDTFIWYLQKGKWHRENGPAIIWENGRQSYYLNDKKYSKEDYYKKLKEV